MLTIDDLKSLDGVTVAKAEIRDYEGRQVRRIHLEGGGILAVTAVNDELNLADESSIP
jgi:hypothetical protein